MTLGRSGDTRTDCRNPPGRLNQIGKCSKILLADLQTNPAPPGTDFRGAFFVEEEPSRHFRRAVVGLCPPGTDHRRGLGGRVRNPVLRGASQRPGDRRQAYHPQPVRGPHMRESIRIAGVRVTNSAVSSARAAACPPFASGYPRDPDAPPAGDHCLGTLRSSMFPRFPRCQPPPPRLRGRSPASLRTACRTMIVVVSHPPRARRD